MNNWLSQFLGSNSSTGGFPYILPPTQEQFAKKAQKQRLLSKRKQGIMSTLLSMSTPLEGQGPKTLLGM
jgi:hypothetical protein